VRRVAVRIVFWLAAVPLAIVAAAFAIANRAPVSISLDPAPFVLELPLYAVAFGGLVAGLLVGLVALWPGLIRWRAAARRRAADIAALRSELVRLNRERADRAGKGTALATLERLRSSGAAPGAPPTG